MTCEQAIALAERLNTERKGGSCLGFFANQIRGFDYEVVCRDWSVGGTNGLIIARIQGEKP